MIPRLYFSYGMTKTGSTLAFRLTQWFFQRYEYKQFRAPEELIPDHSVNFIQEPSDEALEALYRLAEEKGTCLVLKTHTAPTGAAMRMLRERRAFGHAVFRDPREIALSMIDHGARNREKGQDDSAFTEFETIADTFPDIDRQIGVLEQWLRLPGVFPAYYDDFAWDHEPFIAKLRKQTGVGHRADAWVIQNFNNQARVGYNKAVKERWREDLTAEESAMFLQRFPKMYSRLIRWRRWPFRPFLPSWRTLK